MFESKDPSYSGPERRKENRRTKADRRQLVRFEVDKDDRRQQPGRRPYDMDIWRQR